jgi:hypothetical protein
MPFHEAGPGHQDHSLAVAYFPSSTGAKFEPRLGLTKSATGVEAHYPGLGLSRQQHDLVAAAPARALRRRGPLLVRTPGYGSRGG